MSWAGIFKAAMFATGGMTGWVVAEFKPAFPLVVVAVIFILYDAWTAYRLDRRAHAAYPKRTARHEAKFTSFAFGKVVNADDTEAAVADFFGIPGGALGFRTYTHPPVLRDNWCYMF